MVQCAPPEKRIHQQSKVNGLQLSPVQSDNRHAALCLHGGGGGGGPPGLITLGQNVQGFSHHKYESCGKTDQSSSPV